jgi:hypothetical protein
MQQFFHQKLGFMFMGANIKALIREFYARVSPGADIWYVPTELQNPDALVVIVNGRDVGHVFGKGIA